MHNMCLFECQLVLTNDWELTRFYDVYAIMLSYWQQNIRLW